MSGVSLPSCGYGFANERNVKEDFILVSDYWDSQYKAPPKHRTKTELKSISVGSASKGLLTNNPPGADGIRRADSWYHMGQVTKPGIIHGTRVERSPWSEWSDSSERTESLYDPDWGRAENEYNDQSSDAENEAMTRAMNKLGDQKLQLGADLAEARSTINMMADRSITLWRSYRYARRGNFRQAWGVLGRDRRGKRRRVSDQYLELIFGWQPLLGSIYDGYQWFKEREPRPYYLRVTGGSDRTVSHSGGWGNHTYSATSSVKARCGILATLKGDFSRGLNQAGLLNPASVGWELVPFSFVVDWFIPVGNILQTYSDSAGLDFVTGYTNIKKVGHIDFKYSFEEDGRWVTSKSYGEASRSTLFFRRTALGGWPRPGVYGKASPFDKKKLTTALALYIQAAFK